MRQWLLLDLPRLTIQAFWELQWRHGDKKQPHYCRNVVATCGHGWIGQVLVDFLSDKRNLIDDIGVRHDAKGVTVNGGDAKQGV